MHNVIKISIADKNIAMQDLIVKNIKVHNDMEIINISSDGELCLIGLKESKPDILIMDLVLPKVAGFEILDYIKDNSVYDDLIIIIMTALSTDDILHEIRSYDVQYVLDKPFNIEHLIQKTRDLYRTRLTKNADILREKIIYDKNYGDITNLLINMGIKPHLNGFNYFKTAIYKSSKEINLLSAVTKELYPLIAEIYETNPASVERSMRHAIKIAWQDKQIVNKAIKYYGYEMRTIKRPTNSKLISILSDYVRSNNPPNNLY